MNIPQSRSATVRGQANVRAHVNPNPPAQLTGYPIIEDPHGPNRHIQEAYESMRRQGQSHSIAEMLAYRHAPSSKTDNDFFRGVGRLDSQLGDDGPGEQHYLNSVVQGHIAATGHAPNANYFYQPQLAQFPGDPRAFMASAGDVKRRAEELNVNIMDGFVTHKAREPERDPFETLAAPGHRRTKIAPDLKQMIKEQAPPEKRAQMTDEYFTERHGNHVKV